VLRGVHQRQSHLRDREAIRGNQRQSHLRDREAIRGNQRQSHLRDREAIRGNQRQSHLRDREHPKQIERGHDDEGQWHEDGCHLIRKPSDRLRTCFATAAAAAAAAVAAAAAAAAAAATAAQVSEVGGVQIVQIWSGRPKVVVELVEERDDAARDEWEGERSPSRREWAHGRGETSTALERAHECEAEREAVEKEACILARLAEQRFVAVADHLPYLVNPRQMSQKAK